MFLSEETSIIVEDSKGSRKDRIEHRVGSGMSRTMSVIERIGGLSRHTRTTNSIMWRTISVVERIGGLFTHMRNLSSVTWRTISISVIPRMALVIPLNLRVVFEPVKVNAGEVGLITFGPTQKDFVPGRLRAVVRFRVTDSTKSSNRGKSEITLFSEYVPGFDLRRPWLEQSFGLDAIVGKTGSFIVECASASDSRGREGEFGFYEFVVSEKDLLDLNRARAFRQLRIRNERRNFDAYYQHSIFQDNDPNEGVAAKVSVDPLKEREEPSSPGPAPSSTGNAAKVSVDPLKEKEESSSPGPAPSNPGNTFSYSHSLLLTKMGLTPPSFGSRLQTKLKESESAKRPGESSKFRILSLCSGAARIEADLIRALPAERLKMTLVDVNPNLLSIAKQKLSEWCDVETVLGDVNELDLRGEKFDVILCVSALHHVVELEHLIGTIAGALTDAGEFWSIGENVGRNGGKLWPESYEVANAFFTKLERKYRTNRITGFHDEYLPDMDYSIGCFEGIRCERIEPTLLDFLLPVDVCKHNCIIWKLFSPTYSDNFDISCPEDVALIEEAVGLDVELIRRGGRPIELNGVYKPL